MNPDPEELPLLSQCIENGASIAELAARLEALPAGLLRRPDDDPIWMALPEEVDRVLEDLGDVEEALWVAVMMNRADAIALLAPAHADPNVCHEDTSPAVARAAERDLPEALGALLAAGADVNAVITSPNQCRAGQTALHLAASPRIVAQLVAAGAQLEVHDEAYKHTALHRAAADGRLEVAEALLAAGANPFALSRPRLRIDETPVSNDGSDLFAEIGPPSTPRDLAMARGHHELAELLARAEETVGDGTS